MTDLIKKFNYGARWNAFESIFYKAILATHQTCLFYFASRLVYGFSSLLFAIIYLTVDLINLGLDHSVAQLSGNYLESRPNFKYYLVPQLIAQIFILFLLLFTVATNYVQLNQKLLPDAAYLHLNQWLLLAVIIMCESIHKSLRLFAQLLFLNKPASILASSLILIYVGLFWGMVLVGYPIDLYTIYLPLLIQSLIGITGLLILIIPKFKLRLNHKKLSDYQTTKLNWIIIFYARAQNYLYHLSEILFSSNFLIYLFSAISGLITIGPIKLANYLAVFLKALLERTFGLTSLAIFAQNKNLIKEQKRLFEFAQRKLNFTLVFLFTVFGACTLLTGILHQSSYLALLFFGFTLINNFLIIYEQLFLIYNKILFLFILNLVGIAGFLLFLNLNPQASIAQLIILLAIFRIATLLAVKLVTKNLLK